MTIEIHEIDITYGLNKMLYDKLKKENGELLKKIDELENKLNKAEDAIKEAYWECENCYKGVCQYCLNSGVKCYMQGNKVESVGKLKEKLDIAVNALDKIYEVRHIHNVSDMIEMFYNNSNEQIKELDK